MRHAFSVMYHDKVFPERRRTRELGNFGFVIRVKMEDGADWNMIAMYTRGSGYSRAYPPMYWSFEVGHWQTIDRVKL